MSARAAFSRALIARACSTSRSPSRVSVTFREPANTRDQAHSDKPFERRDLTADRGLADPHLRRSRTRPSSRSTRAQRDGGTRLLPANGCRIHPHAHLNDGSAYSVVARRQRVSRSLRFPTRTLRREASRDCNCCVLDFAPQASGCGTTSCVGGPTVSRLLTAGSPATPRAGRASPRRPCRCHRSPRATCAGARSTVAARTR